MKKIPSSEKASCDVEGVLISTFQLPDTPYYEQQALNLTSTYLIDDGVLSTILE